VGFAAAMLRQQTSVLPGNLLGSTLAQLNERFEGLYCLADSEIGGPLALTRVPADLPKVSPEVAAESFQIPAFEAQRVAAVLFTSGSTGSPVSHERSWGSIVASAHAEAAGLGLRPEHPMAVLATVPVQHSYGFESSLHLPLHVGGSFAAARPFYPADVFDALAALPRPRMLVTTPVHLRSLLGSEHPAPSADLLVCATSPLEVRVARDAEHRFGTELVEIYGCTEAGQVAVRRPSRNATWETLHGIRMRPDGERAVVSGGHVQGEILLGDLIDVHSPTLFALRGRLSDLVNVAGKRSSIGFLEAQLLSIPGVRDGAFLSAPSASDTARLIAFAVAPGMTRTELAQALRSRIEPAFMPRPLHLVESLPREASGKLQRQQLFALDATLRKAAVAQPIGDDPVAPTSASSAVFSFTFAVGHDARLFGGHFPGNPILPGARLLDLVLRGLRTRGVLRDDSLECPSVKFLAPVKPGDEVIVTWNPGSAGGVAFSARVGDTTVCSGQVRNGADGS
jgi:acyl-CoA synthetase (AMP-forming)/AMP-acid ligase II/3-hydroxymyristoyl/3-hydroxydecanoyl-(acyl carrier protein) dehydratase